MAVYNRKDVYYRRAKEAGYKSRAAYKLLELEKQNKLFKRGYRVLDCGAAPGGWSQVALELIGNEGYVVGVDLDVITGIGNANFTSIAGNFTKDETLALVLEKSKEYDIVISDIAPHTTGIRETDHLNSCELVEHVFEFTKKVLKQGGSFVCKLFEGGERPALISKFKKEFKVVKTIKPDSTRKGSMEMYIVCSAYKGSLQNLVQ